MVKDLATGVVNIQRTTCVSMRGRVVAVSCQETAALGRDVMITRDALTWFKVVTLEDFARENVSAWMS
jgi:hypothetical protein